MPDNVRLSILPPLMREPLAFLRVLFAWPFDASLRRTRPLQEFHVTCNQDQNGDVSELSAIIMASARVRNPRPQHPQRQLLKQHLSGSLLLCRGLCYRHPTARRVHRSLPSALIGSDRLFYSPSSSSLARSSHSFVQPLTSSPTLTLPWADPEPTNASVPSPASDAARCFPCPFTTMRNK